jgi:CRISPR-associated Csx2 family protein
MSRILMTFLGRVPKDQQGYRLTRYDFGDDTIEPPTAFFGWSLQRRLNPDRLVILGTAGSMWDHLFEGDPAFNDAGDVALDLMGAVEEKRVTAAHLIPLAPLLTTRIGCEVNLEIIPYARDSAEQVELLRIMADHVNAGDRVDLDVTHGFRHLPMLAILAALHLRSVRRANIGGIWYGAYDQDTGAAPVHDLAGLLHIADWLQALHTYDKDGDYDVFCRLVEGISSKAAAELQQAAFHEKTNNIGQARGPLRKFRQSFAAAGQDPLLQLFADELQQRTAWVENQSLTERQYELNRA